MKTFKERFLNDEIEDPLLELAILIDQWHTAPENGRTIRDILGVSLSEYVLFLKCEELFLDTLQKLKDDYNGDINETKTC